MHRNERKRGNIFCVLRLSCKEKLAQNGYGGGEGDDLQYEDL